MASPAHDAFTRSRQLRGIDSRSKRGNEMSHDKNLTAGIQQIAALIDDTE